VQAVEVAMTVHCWKCLARLAVLLLVMHGCAARAAAQNGGALQARAVADARDSFRIAPQVNFTQRLHSNDLNYALAVSDRFVRASRDANAMDKSFKPGGGYELSAEGRHASWKAFIPLGAAVYTMGLMDQTATVENYDWRDNELDPIVKPFTHLPTPLFLAGGVTFETGVNWLAWKMGRSRRWHRIWWLPQLCAIGGNAYGYTFTTRGD